MKWILFMWLCTATTTINCQQIKTDRIKFIDQFDCTVYGYTNSTRLLRELGREEINKFNLYTKFLCIPDNTPEIET